LSRLICRIFNANLLILYKISKEMLTYSHHKIVADQEFVWFNVLDEIKVEL